MRLKSTAVLADKIVSDFSSSPFLFTSETGAVVIDLFGLREAADEDEELEKKQSELLALICSETKTHFIVIEEVPLLMLYC